MTSPAPPQRTAASRDPWSPLGESGAPGQAGGGDPWGGMGPIISTSTIPDPWGGIGGVGVPPSRGSPLVFGGATSTSPPSAGKTNPDPWSAPAPAQTNNDPWGAPPVTETPAKGERGLIDWSSCQHIMLQRTPSLLPVGLVTRMTSWLHLELDPPTTMEASEEEQTPGRQTPGTWAAWTLSHSSDRTTAR